MHEALLIFQNYLRMVWRYRWVALAGTTLICVSGWAAVLLLPNQYEVNAQIFLDTRSVLRPLLRGLAIDSDSARDAALMMRRTLLVRPNLQAVIRKTDMDLKAQTPQESERLLAELGENIEISGTKKDNIFVIAYQNEDPRLATRVVESLLSIFVERSLGESRQDTSTSKQFIEQQIREYEKRLEAAETRLKDFKQKNVGLLPDEGGNYFSRLESQSAQLAAAKLQLREAQDRRNELRNQVDGVGSLFEPVVPQFQVHIPHPLDERIQGLETTLDQLLLRYTNEHPDVRSTRTILSQLKAQRAAELKPADGFEDTGLQREQIQNPVYQQLKISLGAAEGEVAALRARVVEFQRRQDELKELVDTSLRVEAELKRLNRNYEIDKRNYEELVKRRESLNLSDEASQTTDDIKFNIIEPPRVPLVPASPNRPVLSAGVLGGGILGGIALAWLIAMLQPSIYTKERFKEITDLPVLGVVSRVWTPVELRTRRVSLVSYVACCVCLLGLFAGLIQLQVRNVDIVSKLSGLGAGLL